MARSRIILAAGIVLTAAALAGCATSSTPAPPAVFSSAVANPTVSADTAKLEAELLAAWQKDFSPVHPVKSSEAAIRVVFPAGDASVIASYAVQRLSPSMIGSNTAAVAARHHWAQDVVAFGLTQGASPSPSASATP